MDTYNYDGILYRQRSDYFAAIGFFNKNDSRTHLVLPEVVDLKINGKIVKMPVREVDTEAFMGSNLKFVVLPANIEYIGHRAFAKSQNLEKVLSQKCNTRRQILGEAFQDCFALKEVKLGAIVDTVSQSAFEDCFALKVFDSQISTLSKNAFKNCKALKKIYLEHDATIYNHSIEESGIDTLFFCGDALPFPVGFAKWLKKKSVKLICMKSDSTVCNLAYEGFDVRVA